jgi:1-acyl-sn-glycerol-3-phosphate acyltransferase
MLRRTADLLRALWWMIAVAVSCMVLSIPVFAGIFVGQGDRVLPPWLAIWFRCWFLAAGIVPKIRGRENLDRLGRRPVLFMGNHQSALDIPILILACRGRIRFLAKKSLFWIPIVGWVMKLTGFTAIDRSSARRTRPALEAALEKIAKGRNHWIIFPEGTRSLDGALLPYHRGSFNFARRAGVPVVPFALDGSGALMPKGSWSPSSGTMILVIGEPIAAEDLARLSPDELMGQARAFTAATLASLRAEAAGFGPKA